MINVRFVASQRKKLEEDGGFERVLNDMKAARGPKKTRAELIEELFNELEDGWEEAKKTFDPNKVSPRDIEIFVDGLRPYKGYIRKNRWIVPVYVFDSVIGEILRGFRIVLSKFRNGSHYRHFPDGISVHFCHVLNSFLN